ncbi:cytidylyltransferase domain-containing protein [Streptomyces tanashiensis]|uniref:cytidylyltransferase domain-containing protein n=1 Tax=Streptomyces tanashiensis TaxID=67367 RepID=UPI003686F41C
MRSQSSPRSSSASRTRPRPTAPPASSPCGTSPSTHADAYINVQGDEPFISPAAIDAVSEALEHLAPDTLAVNAYTELTDVGAVLDHNVVKVVVELPYGPLERTEGVEMLRFVEHGHRVQMLSVVDDGLAVDTPEDLARADRFLRSRQLP